MSQRHLQVGPAHITLRQPLHQGLGGGHIGRGPASLRQLAAVDLSLNPVTDLRGGKLRNVSLFVTEVPGNVFPSHRLLDFVPASRQPCDFPTDVLESRLQAPDLSQHAVLEPRRSPHTAGSQSRSKLSRRRQSQNLSDLGGGRYLPTSCLLCSSCTVNQRVRLKLQPRRDPERGSVRTSVRAARACSCDSSRSTREVRLCR